jgi:3'-5' exoribonuclease
VSKQQVVDLIPGSRVEGRFLVVRKELRQGGRAGHFLDLTLSDSTGRVTARVWDNASTIAEQFDQGDVVQVAGAAETYRDELQLRLEEVRALRPDEIDATDFLPSTKKDLAAMESGLAATVKSVSDPHLRELLMSFFGDAEFRNRFFTAPGAKALHHAYIGGLCEHTTEVVEICEKVAELFPDLDRDLLVTAAILHDIGKTEELTWATGFGYSDVGNLLGHLVLGDRMVRNRADAIEGFPEELKMRLSHMILSHHGSGEFGSPKAPMTAESIALHHAEDLGAKVNMFLGQIETARAQSKNWTERHFLLGRALYAGPAEQDDEES